MTACDFLMVDTIVPRPIYVLLFYRVLKPDGYASPGCPRIRSCVDGAGGKGTLCPRSKRDRPLELLIRDNDGNLTSAFDTLFNAEALPVSHPPVSVIREYTIDAQKPARLNKGLHRRYGQCELPSLGRPMENPTIYEAL
jgi:hypothetical protein